MINIPDNTLFRYYSNNSDEDNISEANACRRLILACVICVPADKKEIMNVCSRYYDHKNQTFYHYKLSDIVVQLVNIIRICDIKRAVKVCNYEFITRFMERTSCKIELDIIEKVLEKTKSGGV